MRRNTKQLILAVALGTPLLFGYASGPPAYVTGDPVSPDNGATCNQSGCHTGTGVNAGGGAVTIATTANGTYTPGQTYTVTVTVTDSKQRAWGFELTARALSNNNQAGSLTSADSSTFVQCADTSLPPCRAAFNTQFIQHSQPKTTAGSGTFTFAWTAPASGTGTVVMYAAGNAANGDGTNAGDHIYTTNIQLKQAAAVNQTTTTVTSSANPSPFGQNFTLTATVSPSSATGTVTFNDGSAALGKATIANGSATLTVSGTQCLNVGAHSITGVYSGDTADSASTSSALALTISPNGATGSPVITTGGVAPLYSSVSTIQSGSWISIYGCNLAATSSFWGNTPTFATSVGGSSVSIDGKPGFPWFVSPGQINVQVPNDATIGPVSVTVTTALGTSNAVTATLAAIAPALLLNGDYSHALGVVPSANNTGAQGGGAYDFLGPANGSLGYPTKPAAKGQTILLYGVGFGPTQTTASAGTASVTASFITSPITATVGGVSASVGAAIVAAGEYQINLTIPSNAVSGDQNVVITVGGVTAPTAVVSIQ